MLPEVIRTAYQESETFPAGATIHVSACCSVTVVIGLFVSQTTHMRTQTCTHTHTAPGAKRANQTEIVNSAFVKTTGGRWITNPGAPCFQEVKYRKEEEWASEEQGGGARALCGIAMRNQHAEYIITHYWACSHHTCEQCSVPHARCMIAWCKRLSNVEQ